MTQHHPAFVPDGFEEEEMQRIFKEAYKKIYSNPRYILRRIKRIRSFEDVKRNLRGGIAFLINS